MKASNIQKQLNEALTKHVPRARCLDPDWEYTPSGSTDVTKVWRKHGWKPLAERLEESKKESNDEVV
jgi:hypothetical protein